MNQTNGLPLATHSNMRRIYLSFCADPASGRVLRRDPRLDSCCSDDHTGRSPPVKSQCTYGAIRSRSRHRVTTCRAGRRDVYRGARDGAARAGNRPARRFDRVRARRDGHGQARFGLTPQWLASAAPAPRVRSGVSRSPVAPRPRSAPPDHRRVRGSSILVTSSVCRKARRWARLWP